MGEKRTNASGGGAILSVGNPVEGDVAICRIDKATMRYLGVKPGDAVDILGQNLSWPQIKAQVGRPLPKDEGKGIVRIARDRMVEGGFAVGMNVVLFKSWLKTLKTTLFEKHREEYVEIEVPAVVPEEELLERVTPTKSEGEGAQV